ncbi:MAG: hypothetical protein H6738_17815 [Alphaproteobacteria bacterium]|nr:hypothetical protein [Alphaproteobacteria bacterium]MCB9698643.1 hypothetical protein [Alphaproteobacteria bacterium]
MNRRSFLAIGGTTVVCGLFLPDRGLVAVPRDMVLKLGGACSFCHRPGSATTALAGLAGRSVRICTQCVTLCLEICSEPPRVPDPKAAPRQAAMQRAWPAARQEAETGAPGWEARAREALEMVELGPEEVDRLIARLSAPPAPLPVPVAPLACSFCDKTQRQVRNLIAGPEVYVCDECTTDAGTLLVWSGLRV